MKRTHVTNSSKPECSEENADLIRAVFEELRQKTPKGLRYMVLRHGDGRFIHVVEQREGAPGLPYSEAFQKDAGARFQARPETNEVQVVGAYGFDVDLV